MRPYGSAWYAANMVSGEDPLKFDPYDPTYVADPHPILRKFREQAPICYWAQARGNVVFRHRDMAALLRDPRLVSDPTLGAGMPAFVRTMFPDFAELRESALHLITPEAHARIRRLVNPLFTRRQLESQRPRVDAIVASVVDALPREGVIDIPGALARRYPLQVLSALLHIPPESGDDLAALADVLVAITVPGIAPERFLAYMPVVTRGICLLRGCIAERRARPIEGDLVSYLVHACDEQERLSDAEMLSLIGTILGAGIDTVSHLTCYAMLELLRHPEQLALLRADPGLARGALDETLRFNAFGRCGGGVTRHVREDFVYEGVAFERGQPVLFNTTSAFRDADLAADADVYDICRRHATTPWWGQGAHVCLGAALARMEAEAALNQFFARYPVVELAGEPVYGTHPIFRDIVELPVHVRSTR